MDQIEEPLIKASHEAKSLKPVSEMPAPDANDSYMEEGGGFGGIETDDELPAPYNKNRASTSKAQPIPQTPSQTVKSQLRTPIPTREKVKHQRRFVPKGPSPSAYQYTVVSEVGKEIERLVPPQYRVYQVIPGYSVFLMCFIWSY